MGFGKDKKGVIFRQRNQFSLSTLASLAALKQDSPPAMTDSFRMLKSTGMAKLQNATFVEDDGPLELWLCSDDLSVAEIVETIVQAAGQPLTRDSVVGEAQSLRPCFYLGVIPFVVGSGESGANILEWSKTIRWTFGDSTGFTLVVLNAGSSALTTGATIRFHHTAFGVWVGA